MLPRETSPPRSVRLKAQVATEQGTYTRGAACAADRWFWAFTCFRTPNLADAASCKAGDYLCDRCKHWKRVALNPLFWSAITVAAVQLVVDHGRPQRPGAGEPRTRLQKSSMPRCVTGNLYTKLPVASQQKKPGAAWCMLKKMCLWLVSGGHKARLLMPLCSWPLWRQATRLQP